MGLIRSMKNPLSSAIHDLYRKALQHTKYRWVVIFGTLLYLVSPLDISPDVFPILGWIDDGIIVSLLVSEVSQLMLQQVKRKQYQTETLTDEDESVPTITVEAVSVS